MTFLTQQVSLPFWLVLLMIAGMVPLFIKIFSFIKFKKFKKLKGLKELLGWDSEDIVIDSQMKTIAPRLREDKRGSESKRTNEVKVLKLLAVKGDQGMLVQSIADSLKIDSNATNHALTYLEGKNMVEAVSSMGGDKYFLTKAGKSYCSKKGYKSAA